ncbi:hypothetical protein FIBSPDRAFT_882154 [Athelia psychrophila]|uniref:Uncharacterized protein n=1 Tax=Athelia psychrophila TaxID=1759441 RepID=A0A166VKM1_9AGAM|nr:hypothetical protein FIBSPDRAFT_882154 [Fibularhizoctonia sp. CBS 109695]
MTIGVMQELNTAINVCFGWRESFPKPPEALGAKFHGRNIVKSHFTPNLTAAIIEYGGETRDGSRYEENGRREIRSARSASVQAPDYVNPGKFVDITVATRSFGNCNTKSLQYKPSDCYSRLGGFSGFSAAAFLDVCSCHGQLWLLSWLTLRASAQHLLDMCRAILPGKCNAYALHKMDECREPNGSAVDEVGKRRLARRGGTLFQKLSGKSLGEKSI